MMRPMFGALGKAVGLTSVAFVSRRSMANGVAQGYGLSKRLEPVTGCRGVGKKDMVLNDALPTLKVQRGGTNQCGPRQRTRGERAG